jgi:hypothetical protein
MLPFSFVVRRGHGGFEFTACEPTIYFVICLFLLPPVGLKRKGNSVTELMKSCSATVMVTQQKAASPFLTTP